MSKLEQLQRELSEGRIERREFIKRATAMGMAAAIPGLVLSEEAKAAAPRRGGKLRQALRGGATSDSLEGATLLDTHNINTSYQVRNCLTEITGEGDVVGDLAESFEPSADAATWTFRLRKDVDFHNGKRLFAEDVIDSLNQHRGKDTKSGASGIMEPIQEIKADGDRTVVFKLREGSADFPFLMSDYHLTIAPAGTRGADWDRGIGTGPFILANWEPGVRSATKRNPSYFKEGQPYFDEVESLNIQDVNARTNGLKTGRVDLAEAPELKTVHLLERSPGIRIIETSANKHFTFPMLTEVPPYDDNNVRLAIKHAVDREALLKTILRGHGYVGNDHPIGRGQKYFNHDLEQRHYDIDKAKFYLKKAGLSTLSVKLHAADAAFAGAVDASVLYKEEAAPAGIDIEVVREPDDGYWANVWMVKPFSACYWSGRATEDWMFSVTYASGADWNDTHWEHKRFNKLLRAARAELDDHKRGELYAEMQQIVRDEGGVVIPVFANFVNALSEKIGTPAATAGNWTLDGDKNHERWWFKEA